MDFDPNKITFTTNNWFSTTVEYNGHGTATFHQPAGTIEGNTIIQFNEHGESTIIMEVEQFSPNTPMMFGLVQFLSGNEPVERDGGISIGFGGTKNYCTRLTVTTNDGIFLAEGEILCGFSGEMPFGSAKGAHIRLYPLVSQFMQDLAKLAKYWVIPLYNFIPAFSQGHSALDRHPLRIHPTPTVPDDLPEEVRFYATIYANQKNRLIAFQIAQSIGFIEALPDFDTRKERLLNGTEKSSITAVMVGEVFEELIQPDNLEELLPIDFLPILGLATGNEIGSPWVEIRDHDGQLVSRIHKSFGRPNFSEGHVAIRQDIHGGIGYLLSVSYQSTAFRQSFLRVSLKHIIRAGIRNYTIEDKLRQIFITLDNLCEEFGVGKTESLSPQAQQQVDTIIKQTSETILKLISQENNESNKNDQKILRRISQNINQAKAVRSNFGTNVVALIERFGFPDAKIIEEYYKKNPRADKRRWLDVLPYYRGIVMHRSYFDFEGKHDINDVVAILCHLHDILIRVMFSILGYNGNYQPPVIKGTTIVSVDWVKSDTPASRLGYTDSD